MIFFNFSTKKKTLYIQNIRKNILKILMNLFSADDPDAALLGVVAPPLHALNNIAVGVNNHLSLGNLA